MTEPTVVLLGAIAAATVIMAVIQVGAVIIGARLAWRAERLIAKVEGDVAPIIERLTTITGEASRTASMTAAQVEKVDRLMTEVTHKAERTMDVAQRALLVPAREGVALAAAVRATLSTLRQLRRRRPVIRTGDDDDALFIG